MFASENTFGIEVSQFQKLKRWRVSTFFVMLIGYIGYYIVRQNLSVAFPLMQKSLGYTNTQLGLIAGISEAAYAVGKVINGPLTDRIGGRKFFLMGLMGAIVCNLLFILGTSLWWFTAVWCLCRYFLSMGWGGLAKVIAHWFEPEKNGTVMGWISVNFQFGGVVAGALAAFVVRLGGRWQDVFIYPAAVAAVVWIYSYLASRDTPQSVVPGTRFGESPVGRTSIATQEKMTENVAREPLHEIVLHLLSIPLCRHVLLFAFLTTVLRSVFVVWAPKLLIDIGLGQQEGLFQSLLFPLLGCIGTIFLGWYTDRYARNGDRARMMWIMLVGLTVSLLLMGKTISSSLHLNAAQLSSVVLFLGASGFFLYGPYSMSAGSLALDIAGPKTAGTMVGMIDGIGYVGGSLATFFAGKASDDYGWGRVCLMLAAIALVSTFSAWRMSVEFQRRAKAP